MALIEQIPFFEIIIVLIAGVVRGVTGFGFSLVAVSLLTLLHSPTFIVPVVLMLEVLGNLHMSLKTWRDIDWKWISGVLPFCLITTPIGIWVLSTFPEEIILRVIGVLILISVFIIARFKSFKVKPGQPTTAIAGSIAGVMNGISALAGPPLIICSLATKMSATATRASIIFCYIVTDSVGFAGAAYAGITSINTVYMVLWILPASLIGNSIGSYLFDKVDEKLFRTIALFLLVLCAIPTFF